MVTLWGAQNENFELIKKGFPKLRLVARGNELKVLGEQSEQGRFQSVFQGVLNHVEQFQSLSSIELEELIGLPIRADRPEERKEGGEAQVFKGEPIVYGPNGLIVRARTPNQRKMVDSIAKTISFLPSVQREQVRPTLQLP